MSTLIADEIADEITTRLVALVVSNDNLPQQFCDAVSRFCDEVAFGEFKLEWLRRNLNNEEI